jgi:hypothetical protein
MDDCNMNRCAKAIRNITIPPVMAGIMLFILWGKKPQVLGTAGSLWCGILFLTIFPILAYPLQSCLPGYREKGREGQRNLAMTFAVAGYILGVISNFFIRAPRGMWMIYLEYLISGVVIFFINKCFGFRASGHACGVAGPVALMVYFGIKALLPGVLVLALTIWASLKMKRHTAEQLLGGTAIPVGVLLLIALADKIIL